MKKNLLAVDDERHMLDLLKSVLESQGYRVFTCDRPTEACQILEQHKFDLVLLDIQMPEKDGFALYREFEAHQHIPVLFVTGHPEAFDGNSEELIRMWKNQFSLGRTDILYKPFNKNSLIAAIEVACA